MKHPRHGLTSRIIAGHVLMALLSLVVFISALWIVVDRQASATGVAASRIAAERIVPWLSEYYQRTGSWRGIERILERGPRMMERPMGPGMAPLARDSILLVSPSGEIILARGLGDDQLIRLRQQLRNAPRSFLDRGVTVPGDSTSRPGAASSPTETAIAYLYIGGMLDPRTDPVRIALVRPLVVASLVAALAVLAAAAVVAAVWSRRLIGPLLTLTAAADALSRQTYTDDPPQPLPLPRSYDELHTLTTAFNGMAREIHAQELSRRRFIADAAHELRTPLALLSARVELIQEGVYPADQTQWRALDEGIQRLHRLVADLQTLARLDSGNPGVSLQSCDPEELLRSAATAFEPAAREKSVSVCVDAAEGNLAVRADPQRTRQILDNLLANSLKAAPQGSTIRLSAEDNAAGFCALHIDDQGPGIPEEHRAAVLQRFFRLDDDRRRETGGSGLGLAIARDLAHLQGGELTITTPPGDAPTGDTPVAGNTPVAGYTPFTLRATLTLPLASTPAPRAVEQQPLS